MALSAEFLTFLSSNAATIDMSDLAKAERMFLDTKPENHKWQALAIVNDAIVQTTSAVTFESCRDKIVKLVKDLDVPAGSVRLYFVPLDNKDASKSMANLTVSQANDRGRGR